MKKLHKAIAVLMVAVLLVTTSKWSDITTKVKDIIYIDGTRIEYEIENDGVKLASGKSYFTVQDDGNGSAHIVNEGRVEDYDLNIVDLSEEKVYVIATNKKTGETFTIDNLDEVNGIYSGQAAIALTGTTALLLSLQTFLYYMLICGLVITVAGIVYYAADKVITKIKQNKDNVQSKYYPAYLRGKMVYIAMKNPISLSTASSYIRSGRNIYTYRSDNARRAVTGSGLGCLPRPEIDSNRKKGYIYFYHWHTENRNGAHAWYGTPVWG